MTTRRWRTPFGQFVARYKVTQLVRDLGANGIPVTRNTVYGWVSGQHSPRADHALMIHDLSAGAVTCEQILRHRSIVARGRG